MEVRVRKPLLEVASKVGNLPCPLPNDMGATFILFGSQNVKLLLLLFSLQFDDDKEELCLLVDEGKNKLSGCSSPFFDVSWIIAAACCATIVA